jgi:glycosyltransferase involved in cell wall biosynthesis
VRSSTTAHLPRPLRIGVDACELQGRPTGVGRYLRGLLGAWPAPDDTLVLYSNAGTVDTPVFARGPRIEVRDLSPRRVSGLVFRERLLPRAAGRDALDVFFSPAYTCPLSLRLPRVTTVHDLSFFSIPDDFTLLDGLRRRALVAWSIRASARIVAVSDFTRREIAGRFPDHAARIAVIPHGADDALPAAAPRPERRRILAVGSILNRRRLPVLLAAVARLRRSHPDVRLDVVGDNRTHPRLHVAALVGRLGLDGRVSVTGFADDAVLAERYAAAGVAVYLSEYEGFGMPVLEAMTRGVPVVTSTRPATGEIFSKAALTVDPADDAAVAEALAQAMDDEALRHQLAARGRALAAGLTWARAAQSTRAVLAEAVA